MASNAAVQRGVLSYVPLYFIHDRPLQLLVKQYLTIVL